MPSLTKITTNTTQTRIIRNWHQIDVKRKVLGRVATQIATLLMGKNKTYYVPHLDTGDYVVVTNTADVKLTGKKNATKLYSRYSGYPGGLRKVSAQTIRSKKSEELIRHAVYGMLPKNKLRDRMITRLYLYSDENHPFSEKFKR